MLDLCLTLESSFTDIENLTFLKNDKFVYLLGVCFCSNGYYLVICVKSIYLYIIFRFGRHKNIC